MRKTLKGKNDKIERKTSKKGQNLRKNRQKGEKPLKSTELETKMTKIERKERGKKQGKMKRIFFVEKRVKN